MSKSYTYEYVKEYVENLGYILISKEYKNVFTHLILTDKYGYMYSTTFSLLRKRKPRIVYSSNPYTIHNIKLWCKLNNKPYELVDDNYKLNDKLLKWKCINDNCKEEFFARWSNIQTGYGCPYCVGQKAGISNCLATLRPDLAKQWHPTKNGDLTPYDVTCRSKKEAWWQCPNNPKHEWLSIIYNRDRGNGCPYCIKSQGGHTRSSEDYNLLVCSPHIAEEWNYDKNDKRPEDYTPVSGQHVWWKCKKEECGYEWKSRIADRHSGCGCPQCNESKGEKQLDCILTKYNISHDKQYEFNNLIGVGGGLLRFDVPVFCDQEKTNLRLLIEYDGIFHYKKQYDDDGFETLKIHDELKNQYCKNNNIKLLRIPYWEFDNIEEIIIKELNINPSLKVNGYK